MTRCYGGAGLTNVPFTWMVRKNDAKWCTISAFPLAIAASARPRIQIPSYKPCTLGRCMVCTREFGWNRVQPEHCWMEWSLECTRIGGGGEMSTDSHRRLRTPSVCKSRQVRREKSFFIRSIGPASRQYFFESLAESHLDPLMIYRHWEHARAMPDWALHSSVFLPLFPLLFQSCAYTWGCKRAMV